MCTSTSGNFGEQQKFQGQRRGSDPALTAAALADEAWLLCFDEFHVTDIADAMILGRLFKRTFELGVWWSRLRTWSRTSFTRMVSIARCSCRSSSRSSSRIWGDAACTDFRLEKLAGAPVYHVPADAVADAALDDAWRKLAGGHPGAPSQLTVKRRSVRVPCAAMGVARFSFHDLCEQPLAASDYLRIAHDFHSIVLDHIPVMDFSRRNEAKRFIILIDTLYDHAVKLVASAAAEPDQLYTGTDGYEAQEFKRTASRLIEMRSESTWRCRTVATRA